MNPVVPANCPDPGVLAIQATVPDYYMVCTGGTFPIRRSAELVFWDDLDSSRSAARTHWIVRGVPARTAAVKPAARNRIQFALRIVVLPK